MKQVIAIILSVCVAATAFSAAVSVAVCGGSNKASTSLPDLPRMPPVPSFYLQWPPPYNEDQIKASLEFSEQPGQAAVYRVLFHPVRDGYARELARKFDLEGEPQRIQPPDFLSGLEINDSYPPFFAGYELKTDEATLEILLNGRITYQRTGPEETGMGVQLSEEQAREVAVGFLSEHELMPETAQVSDIFLAEGRYGTRVSFSDRRLGNERFSLLAFGSEISVGIDNMGIVDHVSIYWHDLAVVGYYPIISEADACRRIADGLCEPSPQLVLDESHTVQISRLEIRYEAAYEGELGEPKAPVYFVPFYRFYEDELKWIDVPALPDQYIFPPDIEWPPDLTPEPTPASGE